MSILYFLGLCCLSFLFTEGAEPIQWLKSKVHLSNDSDYKNKFQWFFLELLNCNLCFAFWVGIFYYHHLLLACLLSVCAEVLSRILNKI